jgi:hypothetical protein
VQATVSSGLCVLAFAIAFGCSDESDDATPIFPGGAAGSSHDADETPGAGGTTQAERDASCQVPPPTECPYPAPTYADVEPILERSCRTCHGSDAVNGPWPLEDYPHVLAWSDSMRDEILNCLMPPKEAPPLTPEDRLTMMEWIRCGLPR